MEQPQIETTVREQPEGTVADVFGSENDGEGQQQQQQDGGEGQQQQQQQQAPAPLTAEQIAAAVREGTMSAREGQGQQQQQLTPQQLDEMFKVWNPTEQLITDLLGGGEKALAAMVQMRNGLLQQFDTLSQKRLEVLEKKLLEQVNPALSFTAEQAAAKDREAFFAANEDLKNYEPLVQTVFNALKAEGFKAKSVEDAYQTLADRTRKLLPNNNGNGSGAGQSSGARQTTTTQTTRRPAALSSGGGAGGGGGSAPAAPFPGAEVFQ